MSELQFWLGAAAGVLATLAAGAVAALVAWLFTNDDEEEDDE